MKQDKRLGLINQMLNWKQESNDLASHPWQITRKVNVNQKMKSEWSLKHWNIEKGESVGTWYFSVWCFPMFQHFPVFPNFCINCFVTRLQYFVNVWRHGTKLIQSTRIIYLNKFASGTRIKKWDLERDLLKIEIYWLGVAGRIFCVYEKKNHLEKRKQQQLSK